MTVGEAFTERQTLCVYLGRRNIFQHPLGAVAPMLIRADRSMNTERKNFLP